MALKTETLASEHNKNVNINQQKGTELQYLIYSKICICIDHQQLRTQQRNHIQRIIRKMMQQQEFLLSNWLGVMIDLENAFSSGGGGQAVSFVLCKIKMFS